LQFRADALSFQSGRTDDAIYAEDAQGTFAIGANHVFDAALVRPVATLPHETTAAVLTAGDRELWYYSAQTQRLYYVNTADLIGSVALGVREVAPGPLSSYHFVKLIHDPIRPRLYGLDSDRASVVVIDAATLQPTRAILVGSTPTDLDVDDTGATLFVGQLDVQGFARIDLDTLTFGGFVVARRDTYRLASVGNGRVVTINNDQWTTPSLLDASSGAVLSEIRLVYEAAVSATRDRATVFIGESGSSGSIVARYAVSSGQFVAIGHTAAFYFAPRTITALPDGSGAFYAGYLLDGSDLSVERYQTPEAIVAVTGDGRLALSLVHVFDVATGAIRGSLPAGTSALAVDPAGTTAYAFTGSAVATVDLGAL
jgi:hypothetical protein